MSKKTLEPETILRQQPQINRARPSAFRMWLVSLCALLTIMQSALSDSFSSLLVALAAASAAELMEFLLYYRTDKAAMPKDGSAIASALIFTLLLPNTIHPLYAALAMVFAIVVVKYSFGGLGANWLNPALSAWLFVRFTWPAAFEKALEDSSGTFFNNDIVGYIHDALNSAVFQTFNAELPKSYMELFVLSETGIIIDRGLLAFVVGSLVISACQVNRAWVSAMYLGVYGLLVRLYGAMPQGGAFGNGDLFTGLFSGGVMVTAILLVSDTATGPKSTAGYMVIAMLAACFTWLFRYVGGELYGAMFAVALINVCVPMIRLIETRWLYTAKEVL
jgi:electron transport complex protein RnfD